MNRVFNEDGLVELYDAEMERAAAFCDCCGGYHSGNCPPRKTAKTTTKMSAKKKTPTAKVVRCAAFIPGGIQCRLEMYHLNGHSYDPPLPFSTHIGKCVHDWQEVNAEPPYDVCNSCGAIRR